MKKQLLVVRGERLLQTMFKTLVTCFLLFAQPGNSTAAVTATSSQARRFENPELILRFYELGNQKLFWLQPGTADLERRLTLRQLFDSSRFLGLDGLKYKQHAQLDKYSADKLGKLSVTQLADADRAITSAAIAYFKDVYHGDDMSRWISYDELSVKNRKEDEEVLLLGLLQATSKNLLRDFAHSLEPASANYLILKSELAFELNRDSSLKRKQLSTTLNYLRWMNHLHLHDFVVVNIGSATIRHFRADTLHLSMRAVVGTPNTRTPRFATYCTEVILYPYWNVPRSIAVNDLLPRFRRSPELTSLLNMEVLDAKGRIVDPKKINWAAYNRKNLPYRFREKTGCFNPLGVVKFNITDPYSVYLHDTNYKGAFLAKTRFYSHGCIRVEEPVALANSLLADSLDITFLKACYNDLKPVTLRLPSPMPVLVVYMTAEVDSAGVVQYFRDQYKLL